MFHKNHSTQAKTRKKASICFIKYKYKNALITRKNILHNNYILFQKSQ